jgi:hypothetical protein
MIQNPNNFKAIPCLNTYKSPIILQLDRVGCLELIWILKSPRKCENSSSQTPSQGERSCLQGPRSCHTMSWDHARPCHPISHSTVKSCFSIPNQLNPISPKSLISRKRLKQLLLQKPHFLPNNPTPKTYSSKQKL